MCATPGSLNLGLMYGGEPIEYVPFHPRLDSSKLSGAEYKELYCKE